MAGKLNEGERNLLKLILNGMCYTYYVLYLLCKEYPMPNVTMSLDEALLKKARKIAIDQDATISELFRSFLTDLSRREESKREFLATELDRLFERSRASSGGRHWTLDELYER